DAGGGGETIGAVLEGPARGQAEQSRRETDSAVAIGTRPRPVCSSRKCDERVGQAPGTSRRIAEKGGGPIAVARGADAHRKVARETGRRPGKSADRKGAASAGGNQSLAAWRCALSRKRPWNITSFPPPRCCGTSADCRGPGGECRRGYRLPVPRRRWVLSVRHCRG